MPFLAYEGDVGTTLGSLWDKFGHIKRRIAGVMRIGAGLVGLRSENMHATAARSKIQRGPATPGERRMGSFWNKFGHINVEWQV